MTHLDYNCSFLEWLSLMHKQHQEYIVMRSLDSGVIFTAFLLTSHTLLHLYTLAGMALFLKNISFHGILLDALFEEENREWVEVSQLLKQGIASGVVQPLRTTIFQRSEVEDAFRFMAQGKHIGKVLLQVEIYTPSKFLCLRKNKWSFHRSYRSTDSVA